MLFNVVKHAEVREAAVRVRRIGRYVCLGVSDQGRGFDPRELKETPGVGLFSIRERTELLGGRMKVKSVKGKGSTFRLMVPDGQKAVGVGPRAYPLPVPAGSETYAASAAPGDHNGQEGGHEGPPLRVLLVDDHEVVRKGLAAMLRATPGIELVGEASGGREAIDMAVDLRPDVVIMDVSMPMMKGDEATRQIKMHLPNTRVIALSMYDEADKKKSMFEAGAERYILKTISAEHLIAAIRGERTNEANL
jgi:CheY-like chemotaxis protein